MKTEGSVFWMVRLLLFSRIAIVLIALGFALVLWQKHTHNLVQSVEKLSDENPNIDLLERGITTLYQAENNFRFYSATFDRAYFNAYSENIYTVSLIIDTLQISLNNTSIIKIGTSLNQKENQSTVVLHLKKLTDSLLTVAGKWDTNSIRKPQVPLFDIRKIQNFQNRSSIDSIFDTASVKKLGFFKKVKSLFKDESTSQKRGISVKRTEESKDTIIETNIRNTPEYALLKDIHSFYLTKIDAYADGRNRLNSNEKALAAINTQLIDEIVQILRQVKQAELISTNTIRDEALVTGERSVKTISAIAAISALIAALLFFTIIYYLGKIKKSDSKLENEKRKAENLAWQKAHFLSGMNYDIREPLTSIIGFAEQLKNSPGENSDKYIAAISSAATQIELSANQLFDFSKLEKGIMIFNQDTFSPYKAIQAAGATMIQKARDKKLMLNLHLPTKEDVLVSGDEFRLKQIVTSLIDYAIDNTEKGEINVTATVKSLDKGYTANIEIADTGTRFPAGNPESIFSIFEPTREQWSLSLNPGTSLSLPITKKIIDNLGGTISIKESIHKGTIFDIQLHYTKPIKKMTSSNISASNIKTLTGKTILLVDDDALCLLLFSTICKKYGIIVLSASNGTVALDIAGKNTIDLILTDIYMPVLSGPELLQKLRAIPGLAKTPVIAVTGNVMIGETERLTEAGFNEILYKPFREKDFIEKISLFLQ